MGDWPEAELIEHHPYNIRWYRMQDKPIQIIASDGDMSREAIDLWMETTKRMVEAIPQDAPFFGVMDLSGPKQGYSNYSGGKARELVEFVREYRQGPTYIAVILANSLVSQLIRVVAQVLTRTEIYTQRIFTNKEDAMAWLEKMIDETITE